MEKYKKIFSEERMTHEVLKDYLDKKGFNWNYQNNQVIIVQDKNFTEKERQELINSFPTYPKTISISKIQRPGNRVFIYIMNLTVK